MALSRGLASHRGGPGSIPGRDMLVLGPLVRMEMTLVKSLHNLILFHIGLEVSYFLAFKNLSHETVPLKRQVL